MNRALAVTLLLGLIFLGGQLYDYCQPVARASASDSGIYGTLFFTMTGFHGAHVLGGVIGIFVVLSRGVWRASSRESTTWRWRRSTTTGTSSTSSGSPSSSPSTS